MGITPGLQPLGVSRRRSYKRARTSGNSPSTQALDSWSTGQGHSGTLAQQVRHHYILKEGGTKSKKLWLEASRLLHMCDRWDMTLRPAYLPGLMNVEADALSRGKQVEEWAILLPDTFLWTT